MYWGKKKKQPKTQPSPTETSSLKREYSTAVPLEFASKVELNENESEFVTFFIQTKALIWKNYLVFSRKLRILLFLVLAPFAVGFMLNVIIDIGKVLHNSGNLDFPVESIGTTPFCNPGYYHDPRTQEPCLSVGYSFIGPSTDINDPIYRRYHDMMDIFAKQQGFETGKDVKPLTAGNQKDLIDYLEAHKNTTQYAVMFCHDHWTEELEFIHQTSSKDMFNFTMDLEERSSVEVEKLDWSFPCRFEKSDKDMWVYFMYFNMTLSPNNLYTSIDKPMKKDDGLMALKMGLDNALLEYKAKEKGLGWIPKIAQTI